MRERHRGLLVAGAPGAGKSTLAQAIAEYLESVGWIVKTMEKPRDLQVSENVTQYTALGGDFAKTADFLLLVRPDYTIYDELRKTSEPGLVPGAVDPPAGPCCAQAGALAAPSSAMARPQAFTNLPPIIAGPPSTVTPGRRRSRSHATLHAVIAPRRRAESAAGTTSGCYQGRKARLDFAEKMPAWSS